MEEMLRVFWFLFAVGMTSGGFIPKADVLTFNTALTPAFPNYEERRTRIMTELPEVDADIVCLQEVWYSDDLTSILTSNAQYPYSASALHINTAPPPAQGAPCLSDPRFLMFFQCFQTTCAGTVGQGQDAFVTCMIIHCAFYELTQQCASCIVYSGLDFFGEKCLQNGIGTQINEPGIVLMSKYPLKNVQVKKFHEAQTSVFFVRSYIVAEIDGVGKMACTHMQSIASSSPYYEPLPFPSWMAQNLAEAGILITELADAKRSLIIGDLNTSPAIPPLITGEGEETLQLFLDSGYKATYNYTGNQCTYCMENIFTDDDGSNIIDHVLVNSVKVFSAKRVFDEEPTNPLSDHYGIVVSVLKPHGL